MTSSTERTCDPRFPTRRLLIDNSALVRLYKCGVLPSRSPGPLLVVADQVAREFRKQGPAERAALSQLEFEFAAVRPGTAAWVHFGRLRGDRASTGDLGEDESIAIGLAAADNGECLPFVTYDSGAGRRASAGGLVTLDFLDTLAWLVGCDILDSDRWMAATGGLRRNDRLGSRRPSGTPCPGGPGLETPNPTMMGGLRLRPSMAARAATTTEADP